jgi:tryptophan synthase alpha subunit
VSTPADVEKYVSLDVDAVIVGSANLKIIENTPSTKLQNKIVEYTKKLKKSTRT